MKKLTEGLDPKSRAHQCLSVFHTICDDFNEGKLVPSEFVNDDRTPCSQLRILQSMTLETYELIKYLHQQQPCEATKAYLIFCGKILLRLSHLIHNKRIETSQEIGEYFSHFMTKHNLRELNKNTQSSVAGVSSKESEA
jgi:hypothetical protein